MNLLIINTRTTEKIFSSQKKKGNVSNFKFSNHYNIKISHDQSHHAFRKCPSEGGDALVIKNYGKANGPFSFKLHNLHWHLSLISTFFFLTINHACFYDIALSGSSYQDPRYPGKWRPLAYQESKNNQQRSVDNVCSNQTMSENFFNFESQRTG